MAARDCPGRRRPAFGKETTDSNGLSRAQPLQGLQLHHLPTPMSPEEYDKLSPEERDLKDKENRAREQREQAGNNYLIYCTGCPLIRALISSSLHMEATTW